MGLTWSFNSDATGYKVLQATVSDGVAGTGNVVKYDGSIVNPVADSTSFTDGDQQYLSTTDLFISISDSDSGWLDAWTGTELTSDWIKSFVTNGWQYTGDGTTHSWVSIVDGSAPSTNSLSYVSSNQATDYKNYFLSYQLSESQTINVDHLVEGSLSIEGDAQISVGEGVIVREEVTPVKDGTQYKINNSLFPNSSLNHNLLKFINVYRNGEFDTHNWTFWNNNAYGDYHAVIEETNYDTSATYTVTYEIKNKYDFTTNNNDVTVHFANSLKSAFQANVTKTNDNATKISVHDRLKADRAQEQWIEPTLLNGWTADENVGYYKDNFDNVHIKGRVSGGSNGTVVLKLPKEYRPNQNVRTVSIEDDNSTVYIHIDTNGELSVYGVTGTWASLFIPSFRVE